MKHCLFWGVNMRVERSKISYGQASKATLCVLGRVAHVSGLPS